MKRLSLCLALLVLPLCLGCARQRERVNCPDGDAEAEAKWFENRARIGADAIGENSDDQTALRFFRELAGVSVRYDWGYVGGLRNEKTLDDLREIDSWYEENCKKLRWDPALQRVWVDESR